MVDLTRLPPLNAVRAFDAAARHASFKAAGGELNVTPGAISRHVAALEAFLGVRLFERGHRTVKLTAAGNIYMAEVRPALERLARATSMVGSDADERVLRLKLPPTCAIRWLVPRLAAFHARHPDISVQVTTSHDPIDFDRERIDAGIFWGTALDRGLAGERLFGEKLVPVCSPKLLSGQKISPLELSRQVLLHSFRRPDDWGRWFAAAGLPETPPERLLVFENSTLTYQGAIDGLGISIAQIMFVAEDLRSGRLVPANDLVIETDSAYFLTYPKERVSVPRIRALHAWLTQDAVRSRDADDLSLILRQEA